MRGQLVVVSGPSGVGKGTVIKKLFAEHDNFAFSVSVTTRAPRSGEVDGKDYFFKTYDEFKDMLHNGEFLETAEVYGNYYGTPKFFVEKLRDEGKDVVLEIDTVGALNVKKEFPDSVLVFILPPTVEQLKERLTGRNTETKEQLETRLGSALNEIKKIKKYDYVLVNENPDEAAENLFAIVKASRCFVNNNLNFVNKFLGGKL